ncbi:DNA polymerase III subunit gamma and tau [Canibacter zhoujuaniae]|uniref:DNA polymerase III subunit gamma and tau n=1 Tax=Canibacter zhoujuaniae TaxID=2708343 RepID=UPI0014219BFD|nr:DNA polymerase III subunit gamma and tau [Canibacter zhoujuaniae]
MATALYRRYRPENFAEMIGQQHVTEPLMAALRNGKVGHAYLFSGPRGCGKTTSARVLARCLNCAEGPTDMPCGKCQSCVELSRTGGGSIDVVEIDAASHGGVDDARDLRERATYAPARDRYKIFIIDEAHMVTSAGFNALLKIVEEPPEYLKFIFATTEPEKVLGTIRSRTHHYPFRLIAPGTLGDYVEQICQAEGVNLEPGVLSLLVRAGGGSARDTLSILDQLIAGSDGDTVSVQRATALLGYTSAELINETVSALAARDAAAAFKVIERVIQTGQDPRRFTEDLLNRMRDLIVIAATSVEGADSVFRGESQDTLTAMFTQAQAFAPAELSNIADTVSAGLDSMGGATAPRLQLELLIARALAVPSGGATGALPAGSASIPAGTAARQDTQAAAATAPLQTGTPFPAAQPPQQEKQATPHSGASSAGESLNALAATRAFLAESEPDRTAEPAPEAQTSAVSPENAADVRANLKAQMQRIEQAPPSTEFLRDTATAQPETAGADLEGDALYAVWGEVLEELAVGDETVFRAANLAVPLRLKEEKFTVGFRSPHDLQTFRSTAATAVRDILEGALGFTVGFVPQPVAADHPVPPIPGIRDSSEPEEPSPAGNLVTAEALVKAALNAPSANAGKIQAEPVDSADPAEQIAAPQPPATDRSPAIQPQPAQQEQAQHEQTQQRVVTENESDDTTEKANALPDIERYGEAVVRQILNPTVLD